MGGDQKKFLAALLAAAAPFLFFWSTRLFDFDEGIYAAIVGEMARTGQWIVPTYFGEPWFEKPILIYWLTGPSIAAFGQQIGPRLPSVLCSIGTIAVCGWFVTGIGGSPRGRLAMWILGGSLLFTTTGNLMIADPLMLFCLTASILVWIRSWNRGPGLMALSGALLGAGLLAKGPFVVIVFLAIVGWTYFSEVQSRSLIRKGWLAFAGAFAIIACAWYVPAYLARPTEFVEVFILQQNIGRLMGGDQAHRVPWYLYVPYYAVVLSVAFAPWLFLVKRCWPKRNESEVVEDAPVRVLARWAVVVFVLFTAGGSKLPHYILPVIPPLVMILALRLGRESEYHRMKYQRLAVAMVLACTAANLYLFPKYYEVSGQKQLHAMLEYVGQRTSPLALYRIRPIGRDPSINLQIQETSLPSIYFYLNGVAKEAYGVSQLENLGEPHYVVTRDGKLTEAEIQRIRRRFRFERILPLSDETGYQLSNGRYELYRFAPH